jgi:hypothetical protein
MSRPKEPEFIIQWREWVRSGPPKCCWTCDNYDHDGKCFEFDMTPPADFAASVDTCDKWIREIPF